MNTFIIIATIITGIATLVILAVMTYHHVKGNREKTVKFSTFLMVPFMILSVLFIFAMAVNQEYAKGITEGIYELDIAKLEQVVESDKYGYLDSFYETAVESGSKEMKIDVKTNDFRIIFPTESYDYETTIGINAMKLLEEKDIITLVKAEE